MKEKKGQSVLEYQTFADDFARGTKIEEKT